MWVIDAWLSIMLLVAPSAAPAQGPRFVGPAGASHLWLPPDMRAALRGIDSAFTPYDDAEYRADRLTRETACQVDDSPLRPGCC